MGDLAVFSLQAKRQAGQASKRASIICNGNAMPSGWFSIPGTPGFNTSIIEIIPTVGNELQ